MMTIDVEERQLGFYQRRFGNGERSEDTPEYDLSLNSTPRKG